MQRIGKRLGSLMAMVLLLSGLWSASATHADAATDPVIAWNGIMRTMVPQAQPNGFIQLRSATMMHLAMFEAVNAIVGGYTPYRVTIDAPPDASPEAAAIEAAYQTLVGLLPPGFAPSLTVSRDSSLAAIPDGPAKEAGKAVGVGAANAILALRTNDGAATAHQPAYTPGTAPGDWRVTPGSSMAVFPSWGKVATFGIQSGAQFRAERPPAIHTGTYARDYNEVQAMGAKNSTVRPPAKTDRARFYGFNLPFYVFNEAARQASLAQGTSLAENARNFALVNMAVTDGLISSMESKFYYEYWRPVTAIRAGDTDGNQHTARDTAWEPEVVTPPYPSYPSNYASAANAARTVLEAVYGAGGHAITLSSGSSSVDVTLPYTTFAQMTDDINDARVNGGIHLRFDQDAGSRMGRHVGSYILRNQMRAVEGER